MGHRHADPRHHAPVALDLLQDERPHCGRIQVYNERRWPLCGHARQYSTHYPAGGDAVFLPYFKEGSRYAASPSLLPLMLSEVQLALSSAALLPCGTPLESLQPDCGALTY